MPPHRIRTGSYLDYVPRYSSPLAIHRVWNADDPPSPSSPRSPSAPFYGSTVAQRAFGKRVRPKLRIKTASVKRPELVREDEGLNRALHEDARDEDRGKGGVAGAKSGEGNYDAGDNEHGIGPLELAESYEIEIGAETSDHDVRPSEWTSTVLHHESPPRRSDSDVTDFAYHEGYRRNNEGPDEAEEAQNARQEDVYPSIEANASTLYPDLRQVSPLDSQTALPQTRPAQATFSHSRVEDSRIPQDDADRAPALHDSIARYAGSLEEDAQVAGEEGASGDFLQTSVAAELGDVAPGVILSPSPGESGARSQSPGAEVPFVTLDEEATVWHDCRESAACPCDADVNAEANLCLTDFPDDASAYDPAVLRYLASAALGCSEHPP